MPALLYYTLCQLNLIPLGKLPDGLYRPARHFGDDIQTDHFPKHLHFSHVRVEMSPILYLMMQMEFSSS